MLVVETEIAREILRALEPWVESVDHRLGNIERDVTEIKRDVVEIKQGVDRINERLTPIETHLFG